jgi:DASS family divalent anion:Na+ symporter
LAGVTAAAAGMKEMPEDFRVSITNAPGKGAYPISSFTWLLIPSKIADPAKKKAIKDFLAWMLGDGQKMTEALSYAQLPKAVIAKELKAMGPITRPEIILLGVFVLALILWCTGPVTKMDPTLVGLIAVSIMLIGKVIEWSDVLKEKGAWYTVVWMGVLVGLAGQLSSKGFIPWFAKTVAASMTGMAWPTALAVLMVVYLYSQYGFASMTAHVAAMYAAFLAVAVAMGAPGYLSALLLAYGGCLCYSLTHYSAGPGPIFYGANLVPLPTWWKIGFLTSVLHLIIWGVTGPFWWKFLGLW